MSRYRLRSGLTSAFRGLHRRSGSTRGGPRCRHTPSLHWPHGPRSGHRARGRACLGVAVHMARLARTAGASPFAEGRLARRAGCRGRLSGAAAGGHRARPPRPRRPGPSLASELELPAPIGRGGRDAGRAGARAPGRNVRRAVGRGAGEEQRAVPRPGRHQTQRGATAAQGDLTQRQQAIAQLLDPLSETLARYERGLQDMEVERKGAYEGLNEKVAQLHRGHEQLAEGDPQPGHGAPVAADAGPLGRDPAAPGRGDGRHARALRLRRAGVDRRPTMAVCVPDMVVHLPGAGRS